MSKKHRKVCTTLNLHTEHFLILASAVTGFISVSALPSSADIPIQVTSFAVGLKICAVPAGIKKYKSIIKKKKSMIKQYC